MRSMRQADRTVQVLVNRNRTTGQSGSPGHSLNLQYQILKAHRVITIDCALVLQGEDQVQVLARRPYKGTATLFGSNLKTTIELDHVVLAQKAVGLFHRPDSPQPQLLRQAPLPSPEIALRAPPRLRRIRRDHLDPQIPQRPPHLRQLLALDLGPGFSRAPEMAAAVAV